MVEQVPGTPRPNELPEQGEDSELARLQEEAQAVRHAWQTKTIEMDTRWGEKKAYNRHLIDPDDLPEYDMDIAERSRLSRADDVAYDRLRAYQAGQLPEAHTPTPDTGQDAPGADAAPEVAAEQTTADQSAHETTPPTTPEPASTEPDAPRPAAEISQSIEDTTSSAPPTQTEATDAVQQSTNETPPAANGAAEPPTDERPAGAAATETPDARAAREKFARMLNEATEEGSRILQEVFAMGQGKDGDGYDKLWVGYPDMRNALYTAYCYGMLTTGFKLDQDTRSNLEGLEEREESARTERMGETLSLHINAARTEYARLMVAKEKQDKNRPRERQSAGVDLLREDLAPIEGFAEAEKIYRAALTAVRAHEGRILQENAAGLTPRKLQKEIKNLFRESTLSEANRLYNEKIDASIAEQPRVKRIVGETAQGYRQSSVPLRTISSGLIFLGISLEDALLLLRQDSPLLTSSEEPTQIQNAIIGMLAAKAAQSATKGYQKGKERMETRKAMSQEAKAHNGDLLAALLATDNERLNDLTLAQAARKSDEKTKRRVAAAVGAGVGYMTSMFLLG